MDVDECASSPCQNGGGCFNGAGYYSCNCTGGWSGGNCTRQPACLSSPCQHGGRCEDRMEVRQTEQAPLLPPPAAVAVLTFCGSPLRCRESSLCSRVHAMLGGEVWSASTTSVTRSAPHPLARTAASVYPSMRPPSPPPPLTVSAQRLRLTIQSISAAERQLACSERRTRGLCAIAPPSGGAPAVRTHRSPALIPRRKIARRWPGCSKPAAVSMKSKHTSAHWRTAWLTRV